MYNPMPLNLTKVYKSPFPYQHGQEIPIDNGTKLFRFIQYNDGDGNIPGLRGMTSYFVPADAANLSIQFQVTCNLGSTTVASSDKFAGVIQPDVVLTGEGCWVQVFGPGEVAMWADAAIDRSTDAMRNFLVVGGSDGTVVELTDGVEENVFARLLADVDGVPTASTDRYYVAIPAGQTTTAQFIVGETVEEKVGEDGGDGDTAIVVERLRRGSTDYGLILSTVDADYMGSGTETITGATSGAKGIVTVDGFFIFPQNYQLIRN